MNTEAIKDRLKNHAKKYNWTFESMRQIIVDIFSIHVEDGLDYEMDSISIKEITECKDYHGLNVSAKAYLGRTRIDLSIDIGFGDVVYPEKIKMKYPVLLDMAIPEIYAYSLESVIAEKFEAVVELGYGNSRYKDFYDIPMILMGKF